MKNFQITFYKKNIDRSSFAAYSGVDYIQCDTLEKAEEYARNHRKAKNRDFEIEEISQAKYDLFTKLD